MTHESLFQLLAARFSAAIATVANTDPAATPPQLRLAGDPKFGDYQCNAAMALAKPLGLKPRDVAQKIVAAVEPLLHDIAEPLEIAGPGFINIRIQDALLARILGEIPAPPADADAAAETPTTFDATAPTFDRLGLPPVANPVRMIVEYSQPNIAKQMHVGHLRSTIIGDVFARVLAFEGHEVIRQNHIGDWGTQFGMLIRWYREHPLPQPDGETDVLEAIERDYKAANERFKTDPEFATAARKAVAELQGGDAEAYQLWQQIVAVSLAAIDQLYHRLGVLLQPEDVRGESFYNDELPDVVRELRDTLAAGKAAANGTHGEVRDDQGAVCVYTFDATGAPLFKNPEGEPLGMIVQKSDGAYLYATTDLAAVRYRIRQLQAKRIIYVTDARQKLHFEQWMAAARAAGWIPADVSVEHVTFGTVLGADRKPLKTREGGTVRLRDLLDEAERRALELLQTRQQEQQEHEDADQPGGGPTNQRAVATATAAAEMPLQSMLDELRRIDDGMEAMVRIKTLMLAQLRQRRIDWPALASRIERQFEVPIPPSLVQYQNTDAIEAYVGATLGGRPDLAQSVVEEAERYFIAQRVGVAAVKYADLRNDRNSDYVFEWDKMISFQGNTAPYMMYAYARIRSIYRKAAAELGTAGADVYAADVTLQLREPAERALALRLARLREAIDAVASDLLPHTLCAYLYDLAADFMRFYESCPVLAADDAALRRSRLRLCDLTARTLKLGLSLLGIPVIERM